MAEYYLVSQLPALDGLSENSPLPITEERFFELCNRFLGKKAQNELAKITLLPPKSYEKSTSDLIENWNVNERNLRFALAKARAEKQNKTSEWEKNPIPSHLLKLAREATEIENPLSAEIFLNNYRLEFLETLRPMNTFSEDAVYYYGIKLKLLLRMKRFDTDLGESEYRNIYNSILNGDRLEDIE